MEACTQRHAFLSVIFVASVVSTSGPCSCPAEPVAPPRQRVVMLPAPPSRLVSGQTTIVAEFVVKSPGDRYAGGATGGFPARWTTATA